MDKAAILKLVAEKYNTQPEAVFKKYPDYKVLRHQRNRKWYGLLMDVTGDKLGLADQAEYAVLNVKLDPEQVAILQKAAGFLPAYHMNKQYWLSILIDQVSDQQIESLLDQSYQLTE
ncbi:MmcQ/YjbR family DNA-binding protein [Limosilactobacillus gastricus]|uniref:MmcQ/YjbR family DNA-binding protein n=1 Tax=Limosilactobacillus gastricus TaxID=227942 RepID=UPI0002DB114A|nr:MmcQ/YjbR family DNA-binding protein [Limosilactobacillus gastricus]